MWVLVLLLCWEVGDALASAHAHTATSARVAAETAGYARGMAAGLSLSEPPPPRWPTAAGGLILGVLLAAATAFLVHYW